MEVTSENDPLFTSPRKPHKIMQIKRFESSCSFQEHSWNCPAIKGMHGKATDYLKNVTLQKQRVPSHSVITMVELVGVPRTDSGAGPLDAGPVAEKLCWIFLPRMLKNAENSAELQGVAVDSLIFEHIQVPKLPRCSSEFTELLRGLPGSNAHLTTPRLTRCNSTTIQ